MEHGYAMTGQLMQKSNMYSFGVVSLELLTRMKPVHHSIASWTRVFCPLDWPFLLPLATPRLSEDKVKQSMDPKLSYLPQKGLAAVAAVSVRYEAKFQPNTRTLVKALQPLLKPQAHYYYSSRSFIRILPIVQVAGPLLAILGFLIFSFIWNTPETLINSYSVLGSSALLQVTLSFWLITLLAPSRVYVVGYIVVVLGIISLASFILISLIAIPQIHPHRSI
ncbi:unnamed protein product [Coffea canephora]|uniref:Serine-threonine/tyrosine-protein kinase catalytic domain-containing protein n=1 Tax=Coffea canephora TaxID=49390 RepID=A0A068UNZ9_COFCA|nr:unnamed protein product [Coffea canephora]